MVMLPPEPTPLATLVITLLSFISNVEPVAVIEILPPSAKFAAVVMLLFAMPSVITESYIDITGVRRRGSRAIG